NVPAEGTSMFAAMRHVLDVGESLAAEGKLLLVPGLPEIVAVRDWACQQVAAQLAGSSPTTWPGTALERFETEYGPRPPPLLPGPDDHHRRRPTRRGSRRRQPHHRRQPTARRQLGWDPDDLVGRRVVTIVPPRLREAHVAGFSRHLTTGEAHVLGLPLELPVLAADGSELMFRFVIEQVSDDAQRAVYVAWMERI
ncbi:MAG TPA: PAS domain-containing protein, partial [Acidimicrobiales bacterium]|nr:PAS domain-containing protein [Acidimicrobiales bacterium]